MAEVGKNGVPPGLARASQQQTSGCGMWILLLSLSILFFASIVAYLFIDIFRHDPKFPGLPPLPGGLWLSTLVLVASSGTLHWALMSARRDNKPGIKAAMTVTLTLALVFLASQALNWLQMRDALVGWRAAHADADISLRFYSLMFYFLTVLHAAHVVGGAVPMSLVTAASYRGFYTRTSHNGLRLLGMYWHFLDVVWLVLFVILLTTMR